MQQRRMTYLLARAEWEKIMAWYTGFWAWCCWKEKSILLSLLRYKRLHMSLKGAKGRASTKSRTSNSFQLFILFASRMQQGCTMGSRSRAQQGWSQNCRNTSEMGFTSAGTMISRPRGKGDFSLKRRLKEVCKYSLSTSLPVSRGISGIETSIRASKRIMYQWNGAHPSSRGMWGMSKSLWSLSMLK